MNVDNYYFLEYKNLKCFNKEAENDQYFPSSHEYKILSCHFMQFFIIHIYMHISSKICPFSFFVVGLVSYLSSVVSFSSSCYELRVFEPCTCWQGACARSCSGSPPPRPTCPDRSRSSMDTSSTGTHKECVLLYVECHLLIEPTFP